MEKVIISLDQSTACTGYAVFYDCKLVKTGYLKNSKKQPQQRREVMFHDISKLIELQQTDMVILEDSQYERNKQTFGVLKEFKGMIEGYCLSQGIAYKSYKPSEWRKILGIAQGKITREELKQQSIGYCKKLFDVEYPEDVAEAVCIGIAYFEDKNESK